MTVTRRQGSWHGGWRKWPYRAVRYDDASEQLSSGVGVMRGTMGLAGRRERWRQLPLLQRAALLWFYLASALVLGPIFVGRGFFVSPTYIHTFFWPSVVAGVLYGIVWIKVGARPTVPHGYDMNQTQPKRRRIQRLVVLPLLMGGIFGSFPLLIGVPWIANYVIGKPSELKTVVLQKFRIEDRSPCNTIDLAALRHYWAGEVCVPRQAFDRVEPHDSFTVYGTQSWLGFNVTRYALRAQPR